MSGAHDSKGRDQGASSIQPYDSDHTALVHVLWDARRKNLTLDDFDEVASLIMRSKWLRAVRLHALESASDEAIEEQRAQDRASAESAEFVRRHG